MQVDTITDLLARNPSWNDINVPSRFLFVILEHKCPLPFEATTDQLADTSSQLFQFSKTQAHSAYSAMILIPWFGGLNQTQESELSRLVGPM